MSPFLKAVGRFGPEFQVGEDVPTNHLCTDEQASKCLTTMLLKVFAQRHFVADFIPEKSSFTQKMISF